MGQNRNHIRCNLAKLARPSVLVEPFDTLSLVALDLETTGLDPDRDRILEIGALRFRLLEGAVQEEEVLELLVNPGRPIPAAVRRWLGPDAARLSEAPQLRAIWPVVERFLATGVCLVAHNASFDLAFLASASRRCAPQWRPPPAICTLRLARRVLKEERRFGLSELARRLDLGGGPTHRALPDARRCAALLARCAAECGTWRLREPGSAAPVSGR